ncbi:cytochrome c1 [Pleionea sp. CnH1-48]|uniref:cytochrome c1 n=1 Tax=Pleionea sp. CnH1-48 TaxID=2954494 RepID=UPI002097684E|nr:cytochrome c1 [Pleionea sp. CnH1-48]MCO7224013.1 cytochrome c1 [Pleionea sp. CnH1-48]
MKKIIAIALSVFSLSALAAGGGDYKPNDPANLPYGNKVSLQRGAQLYFNYCLGCHSLGFQRYQRTGEDLGISVDILKENFIFDGSKKGEHIKIAMPESYAANWFGAAPPDLSLIARSRGADWLYNYMRGFYKDETRPYGVNNSVFKDVGMPHVLQPLQGLQVKTEEGDLKIIEEGSMTPQEYDLAVRDLVNFLDYVGEPIKLERQQIGVKVLIFILIFFIFAYFLKKEYWKDIH